MRSRRAFRRAGVTLILVELMYKRRLAEVLLDVSLVLIAYYAAWRLRFEGPEWSAYSGNFVQSLPIALAIQMVALFVFGAYRGAWRYFGLMDGVVFAKAIGVWNADTDCRRLCISIDSRTTLALCLSSTRPC